MKLGWFRTSASGTGEDGDPFRPDFSLYYSGQYIASSGAYVAIVLGSSSELDSLSGGGVTELSDEGDASETMNEGSGKSWTATQYEQWISGNFSETVDSRLTNNSY